MPTFNRGPSGSELVLVDRDWESTGGGHQEETSRFALTHRDGKIVMTKTVSSGRVLRPTVDDAVQEFEIDPDTLVELIENHGNTN